MQTDSPDKIAIELGASLLGIHEFSLLSRVQTGEVQIGRARSGEAVIPKTELERLAGGSVAPPAIQEGTNQLSDQLLDIKQRCGGLRRNGESACFRAPGSTSGFTESEANAYRAAFSAVAPRLESIMDVKRQLTSARQLPTSRDCKIETPGTGRWDIVSELLNLERSKVFLCKRAENEFAIIERFNDNSRYAQASGNADILLQGNDARQLTQDFEDNAQLTLKFMASNLVAKAQKVVWEQFPDNRPGHVVAAISERCRRAISNEQTIPEGHAAGEQQKVKRGMRI